MPPAPAPAHGTSTSATYADPNHWLCLPGRANDACSADLRATEIRADGTRVAEPEPPAAHTDLDCFYVYPTVDMGALPGNHVDFHDTAPMARAAIAQAAHFRDVCALYVPLYRQITFGTYRRPSSERDPFRAVALSDVSDAFVHYLSHDNHGRRIVLIGHSQGAEILVTLLQRFFDRDPALRRRLVLALLIGGHVETPRGALVGGTFANVPLCSHDDDTGCVLAYRSHRAGDDVHPMQADVLPQGHTTACVNPAHVGSDDPAPFARSYFPTHEYFHPDGLDTPFVLVRGAFSGRCVEGPDGYRYLAITPPSAPGDARATLLHWTSERYGTPLGLHVLDVQFPQGDLVDLVARHAHAP